MKSWIAPREPVEDIEQGKERAAEYAMGIGIGFFRATAR